MIQPRLPGRARHAGEPGAVRPGQAPAMATALAPVFGAQRHSRELVIWGAHGGAGTSTLAIWLQPAWDLGAMRPEPEPAFPASVARGRALVVTCRSTAWSAAQATRAIAVAGQHHDLVEVLAVIGDGWPEPETAAQRFQLLEPHVSAVIRVPFVPGLRLADDPASVPLPRRALRALAQIQAAAGRPSSLR